MRKKLISILITSLLVIYELGLYRAFLKQPNCQETLYLNRNIYRETCLPNEEFVVPKDNIEINDYVIRQPAEYTQETSFNMSDYFNNLYTYSPMNCFGSCGYVSLIQLMSFYDTFFNDFIIPEEYDSYDMNQLTEQAVNLHSPGVRRESAGSDASSYYTFCHDTMNYNLQSKLTVLNNILYSTDNNNGVMIGGVFIPNFSSGIGGWSYENLLNHFYTPSTIGVQVQRYDNRTNNIYSQSDYVNIIKSHIDSGNPVIVHVLKPNGDASDTIRHSVVAYDYDDDNIYANFGYWYNDTHLPLLGGAFNYTEIYGVYSLDFSLYAHVHSNNYVFSNTGHCGCNLDDTIHIRGDRLFTNIAPTIFWMRDKNRSDEFYHICVQDETTGQELLAFNTDLNELKFSEIDWSYVITFVSTNIIFILDRTNNSVGYASQGTIKPKPTLSYDSFNIVSSDFNYTDFYPYSNVNQLVTKNNNCFDSNRLRCGYIQNEFINLSPRRSGAGQAYLELIFSSNIYVIEMAVSMWSDHELTTSSNATAFVQYKDINGVYQNIVDLYNDFEISKNRYQQDYLSIRMPSQTNCIRIYTSSEAIGNANKGRISLGEITIIYEN